MDMELVSFPEEDIRCLDLQVGKYVNQLVEIGYYNEEHRGFLLKFLYKSEDALRAAQLITEITAERQLARYVCCLISHQTEQ